MDAYTINNRIGEGAHGIVFDATHIIVRYLNYMFKTIAVKRSRGFEKDLVTTHRRRHTTACS
jgi:hypothetical protein